MLTVYSDNDKWHPPTHSHVGGVYLHGDIEDVAQTDLCAFCVDGWPGDGCHPVDVVIDGNVHRCALFTWARPHMGPVGLIVDMNDGLSCAYAVRQLMAKPVGL
jgi:hypothetical protein